MKISCDITPLENATKKLQDLKGTKQGLPEYLKMGAAWKVFGKWMVGAGQSDQNEVTIGNYLKKSGHVCIVLRGIGFTLYFYELIGDYTPEQYKIFKHIRLLLDRVLVTNQATSGKLRAYLENYEKWSGNIFPAFFAKYPEKKIAQYADEIDDDINKFSNEKYVYKDKDIYRKKYHRRIIEPKDKDMLFDIKGCYATLLSILNTIKPDLPQDNIIIIDDIIERCEHGYFLGFLLDKTLSDYKKKYPTFQKGTRGKIFLTNKLENYVKGRERRVLTATKEAFGLTPKIIKKLNRMFEYKKVNI